MPNVIIKSSSKISGTNNDARYFIEWSKFLSPLKKYKVKFTYYSDAYNTSIGTGAYNRVGLLQFNNLNNDSYECSTTSTVPSQFLGSLRCQFLQTGTGTMVLYAETISNEEVYMIGLPSNNINIKIYRIDGTTLWTDGAVAVPTDYVLNLYFEECKE